MKSNQSLTTLTLSSEAEIPFYYLVTVKYFLPFSIPAGLLSSIIIFYLCLNKSVKMNNRSRYLYLFYAASELILIFFKDIIEGFLSDGMYLLTSGRYFMSLETISILSCKIFRSGRFVFEVLASYSITILNIERLS